MARVRFEDVDLLGALSRIVDLHTQHYKEDFDLDKELISKLAVSDRSEDKQLLWMSRPCGTYTLREREVYLDGSHENKVWRFYQEQTNDPVLAYAISLKEVRDGKIFGNLYPLNYREHVERMKKLTCPIGNVAVAFADGNGRMSRLLTLLLFYKAGYIVGKYVSMEMLIEKTKETYYEALQASSVGWHEDKNSYEPFVKYYLGIMLKAYNEFENRVEHLKYHNLSKPDRIKAVIDNKVGKITKKEIMELCPDISKVTVERTLTDLVKSGYITKVGAGPSTGYVRI